MLKRWLIPAVAAGCVAAVCAGCAGSGGTRARLAAQGVAPDDVGMHANPNAPYILPGSEMPHLIARATEQEAENAGPCDPDVLSVEEIAGDANGIFRSVKLAFMNRGAAPCKVGGYPSVALVDAQGENIGSLSMEKVSSTEVVAELSNTHAAGSGAATPWVTLMPHAVAAFQVAWTTGPECPRVSRILVTAPGTRRAFSINQPLQICSGRIQVTELRLDQGDV
ncbi:MAG TPA: DUF4232 domain-containing protein [Acidobacteriaceae bacterium]|nr:DUF4232 domain-containing protein [Acidobacteriaceae bacterium]